MTPEKLRKNMEKLRGQIARKPPFFTTEYARTIEESFSKYTRTSTVNLILAFSEMLTAKNWPFPAYIPIELSNSFLSKILLIFSPYFFTHRNKTLDNKDDDKIMLRIFNLHKKSKFLYWEKSSVFEGKRSIIDDVKRTHRKGYWTACITTAFPLLDHLCRKFFKTKQLDRDITHLLRNFKAAGINSSYVKPGYKAMEIVEETGLNSEESTATDLRLLGIALGSFIDFANIYYAYFRKESSSMAELNRHAIIHCASDNLWTEINATKLLTFVDLTLRLEPVFEILLEEQ